MNQKQLDVLKKNNDETRDFIRSCLSVGLMVLLKDNSNKDITITKLCTVAGVSRTAFYRNYKDIEDVLEDKIKDLVIGMNKCIGRDIYDNWLNIFKLVQRNIKDFECIIKGGYEYKVYEVLMSLVPQEEDSKSIQSIWISLFYTFIIRWVKEKKPKKVEEMARLAYKYTKNIPLVKKEG